MEGTCELLRRLLLVDRLLHGKDAVDNDLTATVLEASFCKRVARALEAIRDNIMVLLILDSFQFMSLMSKGMRDTQRVDTIFPLQPRRSRSIHVDRNLSFAKPKIAKNIKLHVEVIVGQSRSGRQVFDESLLNSEELSNHFK